MDRPELQLIYSALVTAIDRAETADPQYDDDQTTEDVREYKSALAIVRRELATDA